ncbi:hypothetical protein ACFYOD_06560 [Streptomyces sp. NPDC006703]|uniref:hypothetical protein n=1 Tax=Streptomyces sp. NPDC006703 TaxID=3364759 RepID=UPI0036841A63
MSNDLASAPEHGNTADPLWRKLWEAYEPVITALRRIPLVTDVEISGGMFAITAELTDGSHLWIASTDVLPLEPSEAEGFHVRRAHADNPTIDELVYDSTPDGAQAEHANNIVPVIQAITAFVAERHLSKQLIELLSVRIVLVTNKHQSKSHHLSGPFSERAEAVKEFGRITHHVMHEDGWRLVHAQGGADWPVTVWESQGEMAIIYLAHDGMALA